MGSHITAKQMVEAQANQWRRLIEGLPMDFALRNIKLPTVEAIIASLNKLSIVEQELASLKQGVRHATRK